MFVPRLEEGRGFGGAYGIVPEAAESTVVELPRLSVAVVRRLTVLVWSPATIVWVGPVEPGIVVEAPLIH
jgi:hypothetical protein